MSKSQPQNNWFGWVAAAAITLAALGLVALLPITTSYAHERASVIASAAAAGSIDAESGYQIAINLDPGNPGYAVALATRYLDSWRTEDAMATLTRHDGPEVALIRSRAQVEQGRGEGEITNPVTELLALQQASWLAVNSRGAEAAKLRPQIVTEAGKRSLLRIGAGGTALASVLLANHMPQAALRVLETAPERSVSRFTALGALLLAAPDNKREHLEKAAQAAVEALSIDPSSIEAHELKRRVLLAQGDRDGANQEVQTITALRAGQF